MKRSRPLLLLLGIVFLGSCKKEYTCGCVQTVTVPAYTYNGQDYPEQITINSFTNTFKSKKKDADSDSNMESQLSLIRLLTKHGDRDQLLKQLLVN